MSLYKNRKARRDRRVFAAQCSLCHRRETLPPHAAELLADGEFDLLGHLCCDCAKTPAGRALVAEWKAAAGDVEVET
jgi:hypothetical protein